MRESQKIWGVVGLGLATGVGIYFATRRKRINPKDKLVLLVGDSQSAYSGGWQDQMRAKYGFELTNISQGGKFTSYLLENKVKPYFSAGRPTPDVFIIWGGSGNDGDSMVKPETTWNNIQQMIDIAKAKGVKDIYVLSGFNRDKTIVPENPYYSKLPAAYKNPKNRANYRTMAYGIKNNVKGAVVLPVYENVGANSTQDGIHLKLKPDMTNLANWIGKQIFK